MYTYYVCYVYNYACVNKLIYILVINMLYYFTFKITEIEITRVTPEFLSAQNAKLK